MSDTRCEAEGQDGEPAFNKGQKEAEPKRSTERKGENAKPKKHGHPPGAIHAEKRKSETIGGRRKDNRRGLRRKRSGIRDVWSKGQRGTNGHQRARTKRSKRAQRTREERAGERKTPTAHCREKEKGKPRNKRKGRAVSKGSENRAARVGVGNANTKELVTDDR